MRDDEESRESDVEPLVVIMPRDLINDVVIFIESGCNYNGCMKIRNWGQPTGRQTTLVPIVYKVFRCISFSQTGTKIR